MTDTGGRQVILSSPVIRNDSITQGEAGACQIVAYQETVCDTAIPGVALDEVPLMEVRETQGGIIALAVVGGVALIFLAMPLDAWGVRSGA